MVKSQVGKPSVTQELSRPRKNLPQVIVKKNLTYSIQSKNLVNERRNKKLAEWVTLYGRNKNFNDEIRKRKTWFVEALKAKKNENKKLKTEVILNVNKNQKSIFRSISCFGETKINSPIWLLKSLKWVRSNHTHIGAKHAIEPEKSLRKAQNLKE